MHELFSSSYLFVGGVLLWGCSKRRLKRGWHQVDILNFVEVEYLQHQHQYIYRIKVAMDDTDVLCML